MNWYALHGKAQGGAAVLCDCAARSCLHAHRSPWDRRGEFGTAFGPVPEFAARRHRDTRPATWDEVRAWIKWRMPWPSSDSAARDVAASSDDTADAVIPSPEPVTGDGFGEAAGF